MWISASRVIILYLMMTRTEDCFAGLLSQYHFSANNRVAIRCRVASSRGPEALEPIRNDWPVVATGEGKVSHRVKEGIDHPFKENTISV